MAISKKKFTRKFNVRYPYRKMVIITEGEATEYNYFEAIRQEIARSNIVQIEVIGAGEQTQRVVDRAKLKIAEYELELEVPEPYKPDEIWVVFDEDGKSDFENAINSAELNKIKVAYSNECFELWVILHFDYEQGANNREWLLKRAKEKVLSNCHVKYEKNMMSLYDLLRPYEAQAIRNAKQLLNSEVPRKNPSTTVHLLVESLRSLQ